MSKNVSEQSNFKMKKLKKKQIMKEEIFYFTHMILKKPIMNIFFYIFLILIETFQLLYFSISPRFNSLI